MTTDLNKLKEAADVIKDWNWNAARGDKFGCLIDGDFSGTGNVYASDYVMDYESVGDGIDGVIAQYIAMIGPKTILELLARLEKAEAMNIDIINSDLILKLSQKFDKYSQLKPVIGRVSLILRCVREVLKERSC